MSEASRFYEFLMEQYEDLSIRMGSPLTSMEPKWGIYRICMRAWTNDPRTLKFIPPHLYTKETFAEIVRKCPYMLKHTPIEFVTQKMCNANFLSDDIFGKKGTKNHNTKNELSFVALVHNACRIPSQFFTFQMLDLMEKSVRKVKFMNSLTHKRFQKFAIDNLLMAEQLLQNKVKFYKTLVSIDPSLINKIPKEDFIEQYFVDAVARDRNLFNLCGKFKLSNEAWIELLKERSTLEILMNFSHIPTKMQTKEMIDIALGLIYIDFKAPGNNNFDSVPQYKQLINYMCARNKGIVRAELLPPGDLTYMYF